MFSFLRSPLPPRTFRAESNPIIYEDGTSSLEFRTAGSEYFLRNMHPPFVKGAPQSIMVPPLHYHIHQDEHFRIVEGSAYLYTDASDKPSITLSASDPSATKVAIVHKKEYHTFRNASDAEPVVLDVHLTPEDAEGEEHFFRNLFGYLDDCRKAGQAPSLFQILVFHQAADTPPGLPGGPLVGRLFLNIMAWWGYWILGYKVSYPEYYTTKKTA